MWDDNDERDFLSLLDNIAKPQYAQRELLDEEKTLIYKLCDHYIETGEKQYRIKITKLLNILLTAAISNNSEQKSEDKSPANLPNDPISRFSAGRLLLDYALRRNGDLENQVAHKIDQLVARDEKTFPRHQLRYFFQNAADLPRIVDEQSEQSVLQEAIHRAFSVPDEDRVEFDALQRDARQLRYARGLYTLTHGLYEKLDIVSSIKMPHVSWSGCCSSKPYHGVELHDVLPHEKFYDLLRVELQERALSENLENDTSKLAHVWGLLLTHVTPEFKDWSVLPKKDGMNPGFILRSANRQRQLYFKKTNNLFLEYFISQALLFLGIKMPESMLHVDKYRNKFFAAQDLSRVYMKGKKSKQKNFILLDECLAGRGIKDPLLSALREEKFRISCIKLLFLASALNLTDLHGRNIGLIETFKDGVRYFKLGIVDFLFDFDKLPTADFSFNLDGILENNPILLILVRHFQPEDFQKAVIALSKPKKREFSDEKFFLTSMPSSTVSCSVAIDSAFNETMSKIESQTPMDAKEVTPKIVVVKSKLKENLNTIFKNFLPPIMFLSSPELEKHIETIVPNNPVISSDLRFLATPLTIGAYQNCIVENLRRQDISLLRALKLQELALSSMKTATSIPTGNLVTMIDNYHREKGWFRRTFKCFIASTTVSELSLLLTMATKNKWEYIHQSQIDLCLMSRHQRNGFFRSRKTRPNLVSLTRSAELECKVSHLKNDAVDRLSKTEYMLYCLKHSR